MNQEQQTKLEQAAFEAAKSVEQRDKPISTAIERSHVAKWFKIGAETILDNPQEWGLASMVVVRQLEMETNIQHKEKTELQSQLTKYREALEDVDIELSHEGYANSSGEGVDKARTIIKEALKQQGDEINKK